MFTELYSRDPDIALVTKAASKAMIVEAGLSIIRTGQAIDGIDVFSMTLQVHNTHLQSLANANPPLVKRWVQTVTLTEWVSVIDMVDTQADVRFMLAVHPDECAGIQSSLASHLGPASNHTVEDIERWLMDLLDSDPNDLPLF